MSSLFKFVAVALFPLYSVEHASFTIYTALLYPFAPEKPISELVAVSLINLTFPFFISKTLQFKLSLVIV